MKIIGIDLGGTKISAGLVEGNKIVQIIEEPTNIRGSKFVIQQIKSIINQLMQKDVVAIGIGVPSIVDTTKGIIYQVTHIKGWKKVKLADELKKFKIPVLINNDANCFALGEKYFGKAKGFKNIVGLTIGTGLGAGIIINNKIYNGRNCGAGEFCEIIYKDKNLEYYCSGNFFKKFFQTDGNELYLKAQRGDKQAKKIFVEFGEHIGAALSIVTLSIDPDIIIIGGSIAKAFPFYKEAMLKSLKNKIYAQTFSNLKIAVSTNKNSAILGAASLYLDSKN